MLTSLLQADASLGHYAVESTDETRSAQRRQEKTGGVMCDLTVTIQDVSV